MVLFTSRQGRLGALQDRRISVRWLSGQDAGASVEDLAGFQHRVHDDGQLARHGHGRALEADLLSQLQPHVRSVLSA